MPIFTSAPITVFDQPSFHLVDEVVTGIAHDVHNQFGRYLDEQLYQTELAYRLRAKGFEVVREMKITLTLDGFTKDYYIDFLINGGVIIETKTAETLTAAHKAQVLNYIFLCGLHHATLLNFRPERVQHEFVSTQLTPADRHLISWTTTKWKPMSAACEVLQKTLNHALTDWGSCLDPNLYRDVITHFLGGEEKVVHEIELRSKYGSLGMQKVHHLTNDIAFSVTSSVHRPDIVLEHHTRFLRHTSLHAIQWINLNRQRITLHTILRDTE